MKCCFADLSFCGHCEFALCLDVGPYNFAHFPMDAPQRGGKMAPNLLLQGISDSRKKRHQRGQI